MSLEEGTSEILRTDEIIDSLYEEAGVPRPGKYFRFPFFDVGGHLSGLDYESTWSRPRSEWQNFPNQERRLHYQELLRKLGYRQPAFEGVDLRFFHNPDLLADLDVKCTFDQLEYHFGRPDAPWGLSTTEAILARIDEDFPFEGRSLRCRETSDIVLIHDHDETTDLFFKIVARYQDVGIEFRSPH